MCGTEVQLGLASVMSHVLKNTWHSADYRVDVLCVTSDADMLELLFQTQ